MSSWMLQNLCTLTSLEKEVISPETAIELTPESLKIIHKKNLAVHIATLTVPDLTFWPALSWDLRLSHKSLLVPRCVRVQSCNGD